MKIFIVVSILASLNSGCTSSYKVSRTPRANAYSLAEVNEKIIKKEATIFLLDGNEIVGTGILLNFDSTSIGNASSGKKYIIGTNDIQRIVIRNSGMGGLEGFGIGFLGGAGAGVLVGSVISSSGNQNYPGLAQAAGAIGGGLLGGLVGTIIGATRGHTYHYYVLSDSMIAPRK